MRERGSTASLRRLRVLVAEDDREMSAVLTESLAADGYEVLPVETGTEALAVLFYRVGSAPPDAAVMDVRMPGLTGLQVLSALRRSGSDLPVIIITAFGEDAVHEEAAALGAARVFDKPFDIDELCGALVELHRHAGVDGRRHGPVR